MAAVPWPANGPSKRAQSHQAMSDIHLDAPGPYTVIEHCANDRVLQMALDGLPQRPRSQLRMESFADQEFDDARATRSAVS